MKPATRPHAPCPALLPALACLALAASLPGCSGEDPTPTEASPAAAADPHAGHGHGDEPAYEGPERDAWLEADVDSHDFGVVYPMSVHSTSFDLVAAGTEELEIHEIMRSCGCTKGELFVVGDDGSLTEAEPGVPYAPGTRFELQAELNTKGKQGQQAQTVRISMAEREEMAVFTLNAMIEPFLVADPPHMVLDAVSTLDGEHAEARVESRGGELFRLSHKEGYLPDEIELDFTPIEPDEDGRASAWTLSVDILPGLPRGLAKHKVIFVTDAVNESAGLLPNGEPRVHMGEFWIRAKVQGPVEFPERLALGRVSPDQPVVRKFTVRNRDRDFDMDAIEVRLFSAQGEAQPFEYSESCSVSAQQVDPGRAWEITVEVADIPDPGPFSGVIGVKVDHPQEEVLWIQFNGQSVVPEATESS